MHVICSSVRGDLLSMVGNRRRGRHADGTYRELELGILPVMTRRGFATVLYTATTLLIVAMRIGHYFNVIRIPKTISSRFHSEIDTSHAFA